MQKPLLIESLLIDQQDTAGNMKDIDIKIRNLKKNIVTPLTVLLEGSVKKIDHKQGFTNKDITSNHSTEYAYSTIMYKLMELVILDVIEGNIVYLDSKRKAKVYVDYEPAKTEMIMGKNADNAIIPLIDFRASKYRVPIIVFDTGYKDSSLMKCFLPKYLYGALVEKVNTGKQYPKGTKIYWANKVRNGDRYKGIQKRASRIFS
jgi:hypothetical protein